MADVKGTVAGIITAATLAVGAAAPFSAPVSSAVDTVQQQSGVSQETSDLSDARSAEAEGNQQEGEEASESARGNEAAEGDDK